MVVMVVVDFVVVAIRGPLRCCRYHREICRGIVVIVVVIGASVLKLC